MQLSDYELKAICAFRNSLLDEKWSEEGLVSILKVITGGDGLNLKSVATASIDLNKSTQWLRQTKKLVKIDTCQLIICKT